MDEEIMISVLVPPNSPALSQALKATIENERHGKKVAFKKSPDRFCHVQVGGGICPAETWWAINKLVLQVERRHRSNKPLETVKK